jgi:hypothetical protein
MNKCCNTAHEVTKCENRECELWGFRTGKSLNTRNKTTCQSKDDSGKYLTVNNGKKSKPPDLSNEIIKIGNKKYKLIDLEEK